MGWGIAQVDAVVNPRRIGVVLPRGAEPEIGSVVVQEPAAVRIDLVPGRVEHRLPWVERRHLRHRRVDATVELRGGGGGGGGVNGARGHAHLKSDERHRAQSHLGQRSWQHPAARTGISVVPWDDDDDPVNFHSSDGSLGGTVGHFHGK